jgi:hypothetical protein
MARGAGLVMGRTVDGMALAPKQLSASSLKLTAVSYQSLTLNSFNLSIN